MIVRLNVHLLVGRGFPCTLSPLDIAPGFDHDPDDLVLEQTRQLLSKEPFSSEIKYYFVVRGYEAQKEPQLLPEHQSREARGSEGGKGEKELDVTLGEEEEEFGGILEDGEKRRKVDVYCVQVVDSRGVTKTELVERVRKEFKLLDVIEENLMCWKRSDLEYQGYKREEEEESSLPFKISSGTAEDMIQPGTCFLLTNGRNSPCSSYCSSSVSKIYSPPIRNEEEFGEAHKETVGGPSSTQNNGQSLVGVVTPSLLPKTSTKSDLSRRRRDNNNSGLSQELAPTAISLPPMHHLKSLVDGRVSSPNTTQHRKGRSLSKVGLIPVSETETTTTKNNVDQKILVQVATPTEDPSTVPSEGFDVCPTEALASTTNEEEPPSEIPVKCKSLSPPRNVEMTPVRRQTSVPGGVTRIPGDSLRVEKSIESPHQEKAAHVRPAPTEETTAAQECSDEVEITGAQGELVRKEGGGGDDGGEKNREGGSTGHVGLATKSEQNPVTTTTTTTTTTTCCSIGVHALEHACNTNQQLCRFNREECEEVKSKSLVDMISKILSQYGDNGGELEDWVRSLIHTHCNTCRDPHCGVPHQAAGRSPPGLSVTISPVKIPSTTDQSMSSSSCLPVQDTLPPAPSQLFIRAAQTQPALAQPAPTQPAPTNKNSPVSSHSKPPLPPRAKRSHQHLQPPVPTGPSIVQLRPITPPPTSSTPPTSSSPPPAPLPIFNNTIRPTLNRLSSISFDVKAANSSVSPKEKVLSPSTPGAPTTLNTISDSPHHHVTNLLVAYPYTPKTAAMVPGTTLEPPRTQLESTFFQGSFAPGQADGFVPVTCDTPAVAQATEDQPGYPHDIEDTSPSVLPQSDLPFTFPDRGKMQPNKVIYSRLKGVYCNSDMFFDNVENVQLLGKGGNGKIYKYQHPTLNRYYAVKVTYYRVSELKEWMRFDHPNIATLLMVTSMDTRRLNLCYQFMTLMDGNLRNLIPSKGVYSLFTSNEMKWNKIVIPNVRHVIRGVIRGVAYLHMNMCILHVDLKAANILIKKRCQCPNDIFQCGCHDTRKCSVKLADFDSVKRTTFSVSSTTSCLERFIKEVMEWCPYVRMTPEECDKVMGTPGHRAPEQFVKLAPVVSPLNFLWNYQTLEGPWNDIWSIGILILCLFLGPNSNHEKRQARVMNLQPNCRGFSRKDIMPELFNAPMKARKLSMCKPRHIFTSVSELVDLCIKVDLYERPTALELLEHHFFTQFL